MGTIAATPTAVRGEQVLLPAAVLTNGEYATIVTAWGTGGSFFAKDALTRWRGHPAADQEAFALYLRDLDSGVVRTVGLRPAGLPALHYDAHWHPGAFVVDRQDGELETRLEIAVAPDRPIEFRRCTLRNLGRRQVRLEITSYLEVVLQRRHADLGHPAFSKLFVETEWDSASRTLLARRRPRSPDVRPPWLAHAFVGEGPLEWETDRARFLGRGRPRCRPAALEGRLSGTVGAVLDPILSLRRQIVLEAGEEGTFAMLLAAGPDRESALQTIRALQAPGAVTATLRAASEAELSRLERRGLDAAAAESLHAAWVESFQAGSGSGVAALFGSVDTLPPYAVDGTSLAAGRRRLGRVALPASEQTEAGPANGAAETIPSNPTSDPERLHSFNGYGGFSPDGGEYVIRISRTETGALRLPPTPWINVLANEEFGTIASETGSQHTWHLNSREHRLTPWNNDPVLDEGREAFYLQDTDGGHFWSLWPSPTPAASSYETRHGFGYTHCRHRSAGIDHEIRLFVSRHDPIKVTRLRLTNTGREARKLALVSFQEVVDGSDAGEGRAGTAVTWSQEAGALLASPTTRGPFAGGVVFAALSVPGLRVPSDYATRPARHSYSTDAERFLGVTGDLCGPAALVANQPLDRVTTAPRTICLAQRVSFELGPGESVECVLLFGEAAVAALPDLLAKYRAPNEAAVAESEAHQFWRELLSGVEVETPSPVLDRAVNGWLVYQALVCRLWARTAFYQSGGAFGFRDQIQDAAALLYHAPERARAQLLLHARHQFFEGDVLHWWHPGLESGLRTRFADDLIWLPLLTAHYVHVTGDDSVLAEVAEFLSARPLEPGEEEALLMPSPAGEDGDLYEHCVRALDRSLAVGAHGLPLFGSGDWNDSMNRVGIQGRGESVWMGLFLSAALRSFLPFCVRRGDTARAHGYSEHVRRLHDALEGSAWDGAWYVRGYYDDGTPLGSKESDECRIDVLVQAWAVLSGAVDRERARTAMDSAKQHLVSRAERLIRLLHPAFDKTANDPGYIKGYLPGVRENGGQYTHAALWAVRAIAELGNADEATELLEMLLPESHAQTEEDVARYQVEPYVIAADVYGSVPHVGRGGWTWYTGSAGWALRVALESILGFRILEGAFLEIQPRIPAAWPMYRLHYRVPRETTSYDLTVRRGTTAGNAVREARLDGDPVAVEGGRALVPLLRDGRSHEVEVVLGE